MLALFDKELNNSFKPADIKFPDEPKYHKRKSSKNIATDDGSILQQREEDVYDLQITFQHAPAINGVFSHMKDISLMYTVELFPPTPKTSVIPVIIGNHKKCANNDLELGEKENTDGTHLALNEKTSDWQYPAISEATPVKTELENIEPLKDLQIPQEYWIRVNTRVNGKTLAYRTEWFGPIKPKMD